MHMKKSLLLQSLLRDNTSSATPPSSPTAFKKVMPEIYKAYTKQISSRRFTISV